MNLKELARVLGLSQTTVSRALNGYPEVNAETRARVLAAARTHDYRPNLRARALATGRAMAIGHVLPLAGRAAAANPVLADFLAGAGETYAAAGYDMHLSVVTPGEEARCYREIAARGAVDGILVSAPTLSDPRIALLTELGLPFVVHGRSTGVALPYAWVDMDNTRAFDRATAFLTGLGHRRIALVNGPEALDFAHRRRRGYERALLARGIAADPALMRHGEMTEARGHRAMVELLALPDPPTAVLVSSMLTALGVRRALEEAGLRMGREVSVLAHDDDLGYLRNGDERPVFTATRVPVREAGRRAAAMLLERIAAPESAPAELLLEAALVVGPSTGPAPVAALQG